MRIKYWISAFAGMTILLACLFLPQTADASALRKAPNNLGLVAYYSFEDSTGTITTDFSGKGGYGTLTNMENSDWVDGKVGGALSLDGSNEYVAVPAVSGLPAGSQFSISVWVYPTAAKSYPMIVSNTTGTDIELRLFQETLRPELIISAGGDDARSPDPITLNQWHHLVATYDGSWVSKIFVNGVLKDTGAKAAVAFVDFQIGARGGGTAYPFQGLVDEVRIYNRALSTTEVADLYVQNNYAQVNASQERLVANGLVGYWSFDGNDVIGTTAYDRSGQGNNGTLTNGPLMARGRVGQALSFDGVSQSVEMSNVTSAARNVSMSAWFRTADYTADRQVIVYNGNGGTNGYGVIINMEGESDGSLRVLYGGVAWFDTGVDITDSSWHHVALSISSDGTPVKNVYLDGSLIYTNGASVPGTPGTGTGIGNDHSGTNTPFFKGQIDEVRIYDRVLDAMEVKTLYGAGATKYNVSVRDTLTDGLTGYWTFDGKDLTTTTATDVSGRGNNGTLTNGPVPIRGKIGQALSLDGGGDYVLLPDSFMSSLTYLTVSGWIYPKGENQGATYNEQIIFDLRKTHQFWVSWMEADDSTIPSSLKATGVAGGQTKTVNTGSGSVPIDDWVHFAVVSDGSNLKIYLNGRYVDQVASGFFDSNASGSAWKNVIGRDYHTDLDRLWFYGLVDEFRVYNRALSAMEILQLYNMGK